MAPGGLIQGSMGVCVVLSVSDLGVKEIIIRFDTSLHLFDHQQSNEQVYKYTSITKNDSQTLYLLPPCVCAMHCSMLVVE